MRSTLTSNAPPTRPSSARSSCRTACASAPVRAARTASCKSGRRPGPAPAAASIQVGRVVAFQHLFLGLAAYPVDLAAALYRRAGADLVGPAAHLLVLVHVQEFGGVV